MAVVTSQTLPWSPETLDLHNPSRCRTLFPLMRASIVPVLAPKGQTVLLDSSVPSTNHVEIALIGPVSSIPNYFHSGRSIAAIVTETQGAGILTSHDLRHVLEANGLKCEHGLVVLRLETSKRMEILDERLIEMDVDDMLAFEHVLALFEAANESAKSSLHAMAEVLKQFLKAAEGTRTSFQKDKTEGDNPAVVHEHGDAVFENAKKALQKDLAHVMRARTAKAEDVVYSVHYSDINGLSRLENYILAFEVADFLDSQNVPYHISSSTLLDPEADGRGWAVSVCPVPKHFLDAQDKPSNPLSNKQTAMSGVAAESSRELNIKFDDFAVRKRIQAGCESVIQAEPKITEYDTIVGDGDCGLTLRDGAEKVLDFIKDKDLANLPQVLTSLVDDLEVTMGGTSGALYCIYLSALAQALRACTSLQDALSQALAQLLNYTRARLGDRTMLDTLIPFCETLTASQGDAKRALAKAREGMEKTKELKASLGRSTYLDDSKTRGVPDPGAYGLLCLLEGFVG